jgi:sec-independent protein translocase protein TatA
VLALIGDVGAGEVIVIMAAILVLFGGKSLPGMARTLGKITRDLQRASQEFKDQLLSADQPDQPPPVTGSGSKAPPAVTPPESKEPAPHDPAG